MTLGRAATGRCSAPSARGDLPRLRPVDATGAFVAFPVDGEPRAGRPLFEALERVVHRAFRARAEDDVDMLCYLWTGPLSPCFGKDRMATFETHFVADKATHKETKDPYFSLIDDAASAAGSATSWPTRSAASS